MRCAWAVVAVVLFLTTCADAATFTVNSTQSGLADVGSLAHALSAANANPGPDSVTVDLPPETGKVIRLAASLPVVTGPIELLGRGVTISGAQLTGSFSAGLSLGAAANGSFVSNVTFADFPGTGVLWAASDGRLSNVTIYGCSGDGLQLDGHRNVISDSFFGNLTVAGTLGNSKHGCFQQKMQIKVQGKEDLSPDEGLKNIVFWF
jgi:hypothetical protein